MPNICEATIYVRGIKSSVDEFINILKADWGEKDNKPWCTASGHFFRIFDAQVFDYRNTEGMTYFAAIDIECAWSVYCCMMPGPITYHAEYVAAEQKDYGTNVIDVAKRLRLDIEFWSEELGMAFQEHYRIMNGMLLKEDVIDFDYNHLWPETYAEYKKFYERSILGVETEEDYRKAREECGDNLMRYDSRHQDPVPEISETNKWLCGLVMAKKRN